MGFSVSPAVNIKEIDLTNIVPQVSTTEGGIAGVFRWGPFNQRVLVDSEATLVSRFGKPTSFNAETFFTAASFLAYGNKLYVVRAANTNGSSPLVDVTTESGNSTVITTNTSTLAVGMILISSSNGQAVTNTTTIASITNSTAFVVASNSSITANGAETWQLVTNNSVFSAIANVGTVSSLSYQTITNEDNYSAKDGTFDADVTFIARCPGDLGNSLRISVCDTANGFTKSINLASYEDGATVSLNVGSNSATVVIVNNHDGSSNNTAQTSAITATTNLKGEITVTDLLEFGNSSIGTQALKITSIGATTSNVNSTVAVTTFTINFEDELRLIDDQTISTTMTRYWEFYDLMDTAPGQSEYVRNFGNSAAGDELHAVVVDEDGMISGIPGTVLESYKNLSRATDAKSLDGEPIYYKEVINQGSKYFYVINDRTTARSNTAVNVTTASNSQISSIHFEHGRNGSDENTVSMASLINGYNMFVSAEEIDISIIIQGKARGGTAGGQLANHIIDNICEVRKDCVVFISPDKNDVVNNFGDETDDVIAFRNTLRSSSYGIMDCGYKYMYDKYNDVFRWIPLNGDMAGLAVRTDTTNDAWWSPAGFNRGQIKNLVKLAWNPRKAYRDELYRNGINPVVTFPGNGTILFGDKTLLSKPSAFDRINVRRLFIVIEKAIATAAKYFLFEFNDDFTRSQMRNMIIPYLRDVQGRRGIQDFLVKIDKDNNTAQIIDSNTLVGDIYIKPARSINYINLNFIAVPTGVSFSEVVGKFGG